MQAKLPSILTSSALTGFALGADLTVDSLSLSGAPALALSESAPTEIKRPAGAKQLGLALLGGSSGANFAFEAIPYWWSDHSIGNEYYECAYGWNVIQQTFSISGAQYEVENAAGDDVTEISLGISFDFVRGRANSKFREAQKAFGDAAKLPKNLSGLNPETILQQIGPTPEEQKYADQMFDELVKGRVGWNVSFAAATSYRFDDKDYNGGESAKTGAWFVTSYTPDTKGDQISYMGIARFIDDQAVATDDTYLDAGAKILWTLDKTPLSISAEYIRRFADHSDDSDRLSALIEYQFDKQLSLYASHGLIFDNASGKDEVFTALGISVGLGKGPVANKSE